MGIGFQPEAPSTSGAQPESRIVIPKSAYGLSTRQIAAMGISDPDVAQRIGPIDPVWPAPHLPRWLVLSTYPLKCSLRRGSVWLCHPGHALSSHTPRQPQKCLSPAQASLRAKAFYVGDEVEPNQRIATRMAAGTGAAPGQAPPDLPSLLLDGRICYIGMPVRAASSTCSPCGVADTVQHGNCGPAAAAA